MKSKFSYILPSALELVAAAFLSLVAMLLAHAGQLLSYYGLRSSDDYLHTSASGAVKHVLNSIDRHNNTNSIVLFGIWALVGLLCYSIVDNLGRLLRQAKQRGQLASARYVHPVDFTPSKFWRQFAQDMAVSIGCGVVLLAMLALIAALALPIGLTYGRPLLFGFSIANTLYFILGLAVIFVGITLFFSALRLLLYRRKIFNR